VKTDEAAANLQFSSTFAVCINFILLLNFYFITNVSLPLLCFRCALNALIRKHKCFLFLVDTSIAANNRRTP